MTAMYRREAREAATAAGPDLFRSVLTTGDTRDVAEAIREAGWDDDVVELLADAAGQLESACRAVLRRRGMGQ